MDIKVSITGAEEKKWDQLEVYFRRFLVGRGHDARAVDAICTKMKNRFYEFRRANAFYLDVPDEALPYVQAGVLKMREELGSMELQFWSAILDLEETLWHYVRPSAGGSPPRAA